MKNLKISLLLLLTLISTLVYPAQKKVDPWKYEPTRQGNTDILDIIAERTVQTSILDQVVDATNLENIIEETERRKTTVNASTQASKKAMGNSMMKRIFQNTAKGGLWGMLGVTAVQSLLDGIGWVIDEGSKTIYRNKDSYISCYYPSSDGTQRKKFYNANEGFAGESFCPQEIAELKLNWRRSISGQKIKFEKWDPQITKNSTQFRFQFSLTNSAGSVSYEYYNVTFKYVVNESSNKEIMTDEMLADYMLGKAKDSPNPNQHTSVNEAFTPANKYEYDNNPAVQIAKQHIENSPKIQDEKDTNTDVNTKPDGSGFSLPKFCTWAKYVCDWMDWTKEEPEKEEEPERSEIDDKGIFSRTFDTVFSLSKQCPPDLPYSIDAYYFKGDYTISLNWLCMIFTFLGYPLQLLSHCIGLWIMYEAVIRKEIKW